MCTALTDKHATEEAGVVGPEALQQVAGLGVEEDLDLRAAARAGPSPLTVPASLHEVPLAP